MHPPHKTRRRGIRSKIRGEFVNRCPVTKYQRQRPALETLALPPAGFLDHRDHLLEAAPLRERERCFA
jgi:hypothetical protein